MKSFRCKNCNELLVIRSGHDIRVFHASYDNGRKCHTPQLKDEDRNRVQ